MSQLVQREKPWYTPRVRGLPKIVLSLDVLLVLGVLAAVTLVPIAFLVPFNDEWLRMNYLATHSVWEWTVWHAETWVVRPTSEVILGLASLPNTRPALEHDFSVDTFLARFQAVYGLIALAYWAMLYANAAILARSPRALPHTVLLWFGLLTCWFMSSELAYAFYWADGYGNILMPFTFCCCGLPLLVRDDLLAAVSGALLVIVGALGHEVICIYALGFLLLALLLRRPETRPWRARAVWGVLFAILLGIVLWQLFGAGPSIRAEHYLRNVGKSYDLPNAWANVREIQPLRALISVLSGPLAIAIYRDRLGDLPERAQRDFARQRWFWILLALGTFVTCFLPLASVGLKKGRLAVSYYSVSTHLLFGLLGVVLYPLLARWLDRALSSYRRVAGSLLPLLLLVAACSGNLDEYREAVVNLKPLRAQAFEYMHKLFDSPSTARLRLCRPRHAYSKPGRMLTDRNQEQYFGLKFVYNRCAGEKR
ncbi:MAG TPA: hypothetical protein VJR89_28765 [Polyangiales bacterium]|nr:hypothetical protein [Polyangiales bacterium]